MAYKKVRETHSGMDLQEEVDKHLASIGDTINTGAGRAIGGLIEKAMLGGREASGTHKFSETYQGRRRRKLAGIKGIAGNREVY